jgi:excisionase family DNA binding protein
MPSRTIRETVAAIQPTPANRTAHSVDDICAAAHVSRSFVYAEIRRGKLKAYKVGRATRVLDSDFRTYLASWTPIEPSELVAA